MRAFSILAAAALALGIAAAASSADAGCKRFGFTVNDYGKEGPTNDAKALLDKHVTQWAAESGISDYRVGKKDVKCELFLDFVVFDEYTCTASANVCWGSDMSKIAPGDDAAAVDSEKPPAPVSKVAAGLKREKPAATTAAAEAASEAPAAAEAPAATDQEAAPVEQAAESAAPPAAEPPTTTAAVTAPASEADAKPDVAVSTGAPVVETGALGGNAMPDAKSMAPPPGDDMAATEDGDQAAAASSAAAAAAAAAERAAAAAETAAAAAKEAAAAAVAASAANRGVIVPPIDNTP